MSVRFTGRGGNREVTCSRNLNLLAHAQIAELDIGSRCGGFGECGGDRVKVAAGAVLLSAVTAAEREHLTEEELRLGYRLACQCFPESEETSDPEIQLVF